MPSRDLGLRQRRPLARVVATAPAACLIAAAATSAGWLALTPIDTYPTGVWLLQAPVFFFQALAVLLLARRVHLTLSRVVTALVVGSLVGLAAALLPHAVWYGLTGLWVQAGTLHGSPSNVATGLLRALIPHVLASLLLAVALVRSESRSLLPVAGALAGAILAMASSAVGAPLTGWLSSSACFATCCTSLAVFLPLLSWLADQVHPLVERGPRRVWPVIAVVWALPPAVLLVGGLVAPERFLGDIDQTGLLPIVWFLDLVGAQEEGLARPDAVQHGAVCLILLAAAVGLCPRGRWVWIPWTAWLLHDLAFAGLLAWLMAGLVHNVQIAACDPVARAGLPATWSTFACLVGIGYIQVCRLLALPRRGVRPTW